MMGESLSHTGMGTPAPALVGFRLNCRSLLVESPSRPEKASHQPSPDHPKRCQLGASNRGAARADLPWASEARRVLGAR